MSTRAVIEAYIHKHERAFGPIAGSSFDEFHSKRIKSSKQSNPTKVAQNLEESKKIYGQLVAQKIDELYKIFSKAGEGGCGSFIVLGSGSIHKDKLLISNLGALNQDEAGAVFNESPWTYYKNDMMILGAIKARKTFMVCGQLSEIMPESVLDREVRMILTHGYQELKHDFPQLLGTVLVIQEEAGHNRT